MIPLNDEQRTAINEAAEILKNAGLVNIRFRIKPAFERHKGYDPLADLFFSYTSGTITFDVKEHK